MEHKELSAAFASRSSTILEQAVRNLLHGIHPNIVNRNAAAVFRSDILTGAECVLRELEP